MSNRAPPSSRQRLLGISVTVIRLAFLIGTLVGGGVGIVVYLALWVVMPYGPPRAAEDRLLAPPTLLQSP